MNKEADYFSWYPGHIAKAEKELRQKWIPLLDIVIELVDARVPLTGRYHDRQIFGSKPVIQVYTKGDLCNLAELKPNWLIIDARNKTRWKTKLKNLINKKSKPIIQKLKEKGRNRKLRIGVCGLPNVGKSTFLNSISGKGKKARTGNLPGVTKQMQYVAGLDFDLLDAPGICPIKIPKEESYKLALCQLLPAKLFDNKDLGERLAQKLGFEDSADDNLLIKKFQKGEFQLVLDDIE